MRKGKIIVLFIGFLISAQLTYGQKDSLKIKDSANTVLLENYNDKIALIEKQRVQDSATKAELETQLNSLKTTDNLKKEELQKKLQDLQEREQNRLILKKAKIDSLRATALSYPVIGFFNDTLFTIYSNFGSFSAGDRAHAITARIEKLGDDFKFTKESIKLGEAETSIDIVYGDNIIMSISDNDALWNNASKQELAEKYQNIIGDTVMNYKSEKSFPTLAKEIGMALLVLLILGLIIFYTNKLYTWVTHRIKAEEGKKINGITIKNYTLFDASREVNFLLNVANIIKWIVILVLVYIALPILFGIFPWTKNFAEVLFGYVFDPLKAMASGFWNYLPNLFTIAVIFIVFRYVIKGVHFLKTEVEHGKLTLTGFYPDWANPTYQILKVLLYAFMFILIFPYLPGSDSQVFRGVSVFLGFLFTFGSAGSLANVIAGLVLTYMRLFKIGDRVKIGDVTGDVIEKSLLVTRVRTIKNEIISIPNSTVMSSHTVNYNSDATDRGLILHTTVTIGYDVPWKAMHETLLKAADRTNMLLKKPEPFVFQTSLEDFYVSYQINAYTKDANKQAVIYSELHQNIQDCCNEAGIEILSPHYRAARDGNMTTIPASYLDKNYKAPGFNIKVDKKEE